MGSKSISPFSASGASPTMVALPSYSQYLLWFLVPSGPELRHYRFLLSSLQSKVRGFLLLLTFGYLLHPPFKLLLAPVKKVTTVNSL